MKGVIYVRYSSDNQREESIEGQLRECKDYAERNGITILGTYIDRALSAKTDNRPEFQKMIKDSAKGLFDVVLVWKLDRFARNRYDSARYKNLLKKNGVKVISARENISEGSEGIILEAMLEGYAEYYSAELSEKVIRGLTDNALKCKYNGGTVPMGYYIDEQQFYQIDPKTAPVVLEMFTKYSEGATMQELVNLLNSRGMRSIRGGKITLNIMNHLLKNRRYMGEYSYRDVVKEDGIPAIVPKELFERVQERLAKNKKAPARHKAEDDYLLTTKLYCGKCGSFMVGESGTSHTMKVHRYYRCVNTKKKKLCDKKAVKKDWIEDLVVNYTMKAIMNDEVMERLIDTLMELQKKESIDLPLLKKQLAETEKGINNMLNAIQAGIFTPSTKQRLDELEETKSQLEVSILQEEMHKPLLTREQIAFFIYRFRKFDVTKREQRQRLIDSFVNAVYLYEDKIILTFNYKDGSKTITLADVEGSDLSSFGAVKSADKFSTFLFCVALRVALCCEKTRISCIIRVIMQNGKGEDFFMKAISWNVNGLRAVLGKNFMEVFNGLDADLFCLQETKLQEGQVELDLPGYYQYWNYAEKKGYSGTAIFTRQEPVSVSYGMGIEEHDQEGRVITLEFEEYYFITVYTPNSKQELERLDYRQQWEDDFREYLCKLKEKKPVIFCGDLNVAHKEIDLKNPKTNHHNAGFTDEERNKMTQLLEAGFVDTFRHFYPDQEGIYSWWSYRFKAREKNAGWRIDYFIVSEDFKERITGAKIHTDITGSDHCPVELEWK